MAATITTPPTRGQLQDMCRGQKPEGVYSEQTADGKTQHYVLFGGGFKMYVSDYMAELLRDDLQELRTKGRVTLNK